MSKPIALPELTHRWLQESLGAISEKTLNHYASIMESHVFPRFGDSVEISSEEIQSYFQEKKAQGFSDSSVNQTVRILQHILRYGASLGLCPEPKWGFALKKAARKREAVVLSPAEENQLASFLIDNPSPKNLCIFLILTSGVTVGEIMEVQWKHVSLLKNFFRVHVTRGPVTNKRHRTRQIPIDERQKIYLKKMARVPEAYLCTGREKQPKPHALGSYWHKLVEAQLVPDVSLTELRRTFVVHSLEHGLPIDQVAKQVGVRYDRFFRSTYFPLLLPATRARLEKEVLESRKIRETPAHIYKPEADAESTEYRKKIAARRQELKEELQSLEGNLAIIRTLRNSDGVQGASRNGLYSFIEKVLGEDKDGQYLVEYLRYNMRVEDMPLRKVTTSQAIHRRVTKGFEKLNTRLDQIYAVEGYDMLDLFHQLCAKIEEVAPAAPAKRGPKPKPSLESDFKKAMEALERINKQSE